MNKRGFTLVELLATLTILVLMSLIIGVNITSILKSTEDMEDNAKKEQVEKAACVFADSAKRYEYQDANEYSNCNTSGCTIKVSDLYAAGLLNNDFEGTDYISKSVTVTYDVEGEKQCKFNE